MALSSQHIAPDGRPEFLVTLGVLLPCNEEDVKQAYLAKVRDAHPDRGGDPAEFRRIQEAFEKASEYARFSASRTRWLAASIERYAAQEALREELERRGGRVEVEQLAWLEQEIGADFAQVMERLVALEFHGPEHDDRLIDYLAREAGLLGNLRRLDLSGTRVTDAGVERLYAFKGLRELDLSGTPIDGSGLAVLQQLPALEWVGLRDVGLSLRSKLWLRWNHARIAQLA
jgi:hypothetical protein